MENSLQGLTMHGLILHGKFILKNKLFQSPAKFSKQTRWMFETFYIERRFS
jgi:hypothetical protein